MAIFGPCTAAIYNAISTDANTLQLPLGLLTAAQGHPMLVELKNGETYNGILVLCDTWMNLVLGGEVVQTSPDGDEFVRLEWAYVKGNNVSVLAWYIDMTGFC